MLGRLRSQPEDKHSLPIFPPGPPPPRAPATYVPVPVPVFTWTGVYIGVNGGYGFGDSNWTSPLPRRLASRPATSAPTASSSAARIGGNYQWGQFVLGVEADGDWTNLTGTSSSPLAVAFGRLHDPERLARHSARPRRLCLGSRPVLRDGRRRFRRSPGWRRRAPFSSSTQIGWTAGAGVEFAFTPNLTGKVEYLYVDLGNQSCTAVYCGFSAAALPTTVTLTENIVRAGINYKFW